MSDLETTGIGPAVSAYFRLEGDVSNGLNRLKAKLFNLVEGSITEPTQREALKGLIRGFANDEYTIIVQNMRYDAIAAGYLPKKEADMFPPMSAAPLENSELTLI